MADDYYKSNFIFFHLGKNKVNTFKLYSEMDILQVPNGGVFKWPACILTEAQYNILDTIFCALFVDKAMTGAVYSNHFCIFL